MKLNSKASYAVKAIVDLLAHGDGQPVALAELAARQDLSLSYLEQLFARLRRAGLVRAVRGPGGGYLLARPASEITAAAVVAAIAEEPTADTRCVPSQPMHCKRRDDFCLTHELWENLSGEIERFLGSVSIEDVIARSLPPMNGPGR